MGKKYVMKGQKDVVIWVPGVPTEKISEGPGSLLRFGTTETARIRGPYTLT